MPSDIPVELIQSGARIAGALIGEIFKALAAGEDIEPLISKLPPETQKVARRELQDQETLDALRDARERILGDGE